MDGLFNDIKAKITEIAPEITFVQMYNGQFDDLGDNNSEEGMRMYAFPMPAAFVEFDDDIEWHQLGAGYQIADPLFVTIHLAHNLLDAADGTMEQNLAVYALAQKLFKGFNKFEPDGAVQFIRVGHTQDKNHDQVYHFQQKYRTSYVDQERAEPVNGVLKDPPTGLELNVEYDPSPFLKQLPDEENILLLESGEALTLEDGENILL